MHVHCPRGCLSQYAWIFLEDGDVACFSFITRNVFGFITTPKTEWQPYFQGGSSISLSSIQEYGNEKCLSSVHQMHSYLVPRKIKTIVSEYVGAVNKLSQKFEIQEELIEIEYKLSSNCYQNGPWAPRPTLYCNAGSAAMSYVCLTCQWRRRLDGSQCKTPQAVLRMAHIRYRPCGEGGSTGKWLKGLDLSHLCNSIKPVEGKMDG